MRELSWMWGSYKLVQYMGETPHKRNTLVTNYPGVKYPGVRYPGVKYQGLTLPSGELF